ncbi:MAG: family NAD(P)-dependent oxidoreductase [Solirubrobacterales bacterium]|nr:family NAD(P)-dependent oxidoreductase [Solirubrobacterales bacterium]
MAKYDVNGRTVLITGAARGIGAESARRLHGKGANVALVGLEPDRMEALAAELGERVAVFEADTTDTGALERAVAGAVQRFGGIDVGIANAGIQMTGAVATAPERSVERTLEVNLLGVWRTDRALLPQITARGGYLLNVASLAAATHAPLMAAYAASKAGVEAFTNALRIETSVTRARVGCAYFGFIDTDIVRGSFAQPSSAQMRRMLPPFMREPAPLVQAIDAIEKGIEKRSARLWAPRYVGPALALRGILQPLSEFQMMRMGRKDLAEAIRLADPATGADKPEDELLGAAGITAGTLPGAGPTRSIGA